MKDRRPTSVSADIPIGPIPEVPMRLSRQQCVQLLLMLSLVGCSFSPVSPGVAGGMAGSGTGVPGSAGVGGTGVVSGAAGQVGGGDVVLTGTGGAAGMSCGQATVPIMPLPPDILIIQDRSGSMDDNSSDKACNGGCGANSKWAQITAAINNVVSQTDTTVNWGLKFFADKDATCGVNPGVAVPVAPMNSGPIAAAITASTSANGGVANGSRTPTAQAIGVGTTYLGTLTDPNPKYLLVATDGLPNCATGNANGDNSPATEQAVAAALTAGYPTFVVGIATTSDATATATLNAMAVNGGEPQTGGMTSYYSVTDTASLETALNKIIGIVASCTISLANAPKGFNNIVISATDASTGMPVAIPQDPTNGWSYDATKANVILNGTACANLQSGTYSDFNFNYACAGVVICIDNCSTQ